MIFMNPLRCVSCTQISPSSTQLNLSFLQTNSVSEMGFLIRAALPAEPLEGPGQGYHGCSHLEGCSGILLRGNLLFRFNEFL